jgi:hypothetical protein
LNEAILLNNVRARFALHKQIYTYIGDVLLSVNPYDQFPQVYSDQTLDQYLDIASPLDRPPHVFATASLAYAAMRRERAPQAVLVSGESGSGKTEATRWLLKLLSRQSVRAAQSSTTVVASSTQQQRRVEAALLHAGPLLEAFGNAKTVRNDNSSRFGKYVEIVFDDRGVIVGATLQHFLLEKVRVVQRSPSERNFHVFYQLVLGATPAERAKWNLFDNVAAYRLLRGDAMTVPGVDDAAHFARVRQAMQVLGFEQRECELVFGTLAFVLNLGNLTFKADVAAITSLDDRRTLQPAADFLGCTADELTTALLKKPFRGAGRASTYAIPLQPAEAAAARDALCAATYAVLFDWLVRRIATSLAPPEGFAAARPLPVVGGDDATAARSASVGGGFARGGASVSGRGAPAMRGGATLGRGGGGGIRARGGAAIRSTALSTEEPATPSTGGGSSAQQLPGSTLRGGGVHTPAVQSIGVLDVFGFETLEHNSLEQMLINYANERLQALFTEQVLKAEQDEYAAEGVVWQRVAYRDNAAVLALLEHRPRGAFALLDEECVLPAGSDAKLREKFDEALVAVAASAGVSSTDAVYATVRGDKTHFDVRHYAGVVRYDADGWLDKNRDSLLAHLELLMLQSANAFVRDLFLPHCMDTASDTARSRVRVTLAGLFRKQLSALLGTIGQCGVFHIRCVPANATKSPSRFDAPYVLRQLRQVGVLEAVAVRRSGFALRRTFAAACRRYMSILPPPYAPQWRRSSSRLSSYLRDPDPPSDARAAIVALVESVLGTDGSKSASNNRMPAFYIGRTKLFMSASAARTVDELAARAEAERAEREAELRRAREEAERRAREEAERRAREEALERERIEAERVWREQQEELARAENERVARERAERARAQQEAASREAEIRAREAEAERRDAALRQRQVELVAEREQLLTARQAELAAERQRLVDEARRLDARVRSAPFSTDEPTTMAPTPMQRSQTNARPNAGRTPPVPVARPAAATNAAPIAALSSSPPGGIYACLPPRRPEAVEPVVAPAPLPRRGGDALPDAILKLASASDAGVSPERLKARNFDDDLDWGDLDAQLPRPPTQQQKGPAPSKPAASKPSKPAIKSGQTLSPTSPRKNAPATKVVGFASDSVVDAATVRAATNAAANKPAQLPTERTKTMSSGAVPPPTHAATMRDSRNTSITAQVKGGLKALSKRFFRKKSVAQIARDAGVESLRDEDGSNIFTPSVNGAEKQLHLAELFDEIDAEVESGAPVSPRGGTVVARTDSAPSIATPAAAPLASPRGTDAAAEDVVSRWRASEDEYITIVNTVLKEYFFELEKTAALDLAAVFQNLRELSRHAASLSLALRAARAQRVRRVEAVFDALLPAVRQYCEGYPRAVSVLAEARRSSPAVRDAVAICDATAASKLKDGAKIDGPITLANLLARPFVRAGAQIALCERWAAVCPSDERSRVAALAVQLTNLLDALPDGNYLQLIEDADADGEIALEELTVIDPEPISASPPPRVVSPPPRVASPPPRVASPQPVPRIASPQPGAAAAAAKRAAAEDERRAVAEKAAAEKAAAEKRAAAEKAAAEKRAADEEARAKAQRAADEKRAADEERAKAQQRAAAEEERANAKRAAEAAMIDEEIARIEREEAEIAKAEREAAELEEFALQLETERKEREAVEKAERAEKAKRDAEEKAKREADEKAERLKREAKEKAKRDAELIEAEIARVELEEARQREAAEKVRRDAEAKRRREEEERARQQREAAERAKREADERERREADERKEAARQLEAKREAEEQARRAAEEQKRVAEEQKRAIIDKRRREAAEVERLLAEEDAKTQREEATRQKAAAEKAAAERAAVDRIMSDAESASEAKKLDTIRTLLIVKCQRSSAILNKLHDETAAIETMADIQAHKLWFAALAECKKALATLELGGDETYVPIKLGDWLSDDVRTYLSAIFATLWRVQRKFAALERSLTNTAADKQALVKFAPLVKKCAEQLEALNV